MDTPRDHGGNLDAAIAQYGGTEWCDLSTGINPMPYPVPRLTPESWAVLPRKSSMQRLKLAAQTAYGTDAPVIPFAGAQGAIQAMPFLSEPGTARIISPTYNEHAAALRMGGWQVQPVENAEALSGADMAVIVNPNNPDGRRLPPSALRELSHNVRLLIVDESFVDPEPDLSLAPVFTEENIVLLRSFGKFYGLAGLRLGFAIAHGPRAARLADLAGPWPISGPAIDIASAALSDTAWQANTITRLTQDAARLDTLAKTAGWSLVGGTPLFRTYQTPDAKEAQTKLARHQIWSRIFPYSNNWIRLGLPATSHWPRLEQALHP